MQDVTGEPVDPQWREPLWTTEKVSDELFRRFPKDSKAMVFFNVLLPFVMEVVEQYEVDRDNFCAAQDYYIGVVDSKDADRARLVAQVEALQAAGEWRPLPDGQIPESNLWIVSAHGDGWFLEFGKNGAKVWFPGVVRLFVDSTQIKIKEAADNE